MIGQVKTIGGQKIVVPISGSIPVGNPVGTLLTTYKKIQPRNYLYCDGSTFNAGQYPALYLYLGTNVLPDYRECVMVGAEQNTTDTIAAHDVYTQGQFKDDQLQDHSHKIKRTGLAGGSAMEGVVNWTSGGNQVNTSQASISEDARVGTTTHGKQKAVYVYIKAVDGVDISDEDTFLDTVKNFVQEKNSYSTTEMLTGGKWIDGKPIYRKVLTGTLTVSGGGSIRLSAWSNFSNIDTLIKLKGTLKQIEGGYISLFNMNEKNGRLYIAQSGSPNGLVFQTETTRTNVSYQVTLEYTKTTD